MYLKACQRQIMFCEAALCNWQRDQTTRPWRGSSSVDWAGSGADGIQGGWAPPGPPLAQPHAPETLDPRQEQKCTCRTARTQSVTPRLSQHSTELPRCQGDLQTFLRATQPLPHSWLLDQCLAQRNTSMLLSCELTALQGQGVDFQHLFPSAPLPVPCVLMFHLRNGTDSAQIKPPNLHPAPSASSHSQRRLSTFLIPSLPQFITEK